MRPILIAVPALFLAGAVGAYAQNASHTVTVESADRLSTNIVGLEVHDGQKNVGSRAFRRTIQPAPGASHQTARHWSRINKGRDRRSGTEP